MSHNGDYAWAPLFAVLADDHKRLIPGEIVDTLNAFQGEHVFETSTRYPPFDNAPRNFTTWLSEKLTIGAESFDEIVVGGPSRSQTSFNPAVVQWDTGDEISFLTVSFPFCSRGGGTGGGRLVERDDDAAELRLCPPPPESSILRRSPACVHKIKVTNA